MSVWRELMIAKMKAGGDAPADNEVWYYAPSQVTLYSETGVLSHTFSGGKGVLTFADAVTTISNWLQGTAITDVKFPSTVTSIGTDAFYGCSSLALTSLPSGITSIANYAFSNCAGLVSLRFLGTPTTIGSIAFFLTLNLVDIYVPWSEGAVANAPWGATNATIHYNS